LESSRKNINEEVQVLTIANAFNEYFLLLVEKKCVDNGGGSIGHDDSGIGDNYNSIYTQIYYFLNAFNNSFPNIKLESATTAQEI